jgi:hypothetical protein
MPLRRAGFHALLLALGLALISLVLPHARAGAVDAPFAGPAPVAAGTSAANIPLNGAQKRIMVRWVARSTGTLSALHLRLQANGSACRLDGKTGYGAGNGGSWHATTHPVLPDGRPDQGITLATQDFRPCDGPLAVVDARQGIVRLAMQLAVKQGAEYATVLRNDDPAPTTNYTSANFLYTATGILGANARNERSPLAPDSYYGLDPRELVGYSVDSGRTWALPGGPYGAPGGRNFLPTYLQEYADGSIGGQPFYYAATPSTAPRTMVFGNIRHTWVIRELGAWTRSQGAGTLSLSVNGRVITTVPVSGIGMLRVPISPVTVAPGQVVRVTATGLTIQNIVADTAWGRLIGMHLATTPWKVDGERNFSHAAPVYALPAYDAAPPASSPPPITGSGAPSPTGNTQTPVPAHRPSRRHRRTWHTERVFG